MKCIRSLLTLVITALLLLLISPAAAALDVAVNGTALSFTTADGQPFIENGCTLVPLRAAAEAYGATVQWNAANKTAVITKNGITVTVPIDDNHVYRNGEPIVNDVAAKIVDSRTYLPIRVVMEAFGADVGWDAATQTVTINDPDKIFLRNVEAGLGGMDAVAKGIALNDQAKQYANAGEFHHAALCYSRAADYWDQVHGQGETALHARNMADIVDADVRLFLHTSDSAYDRTTYFGAPNEPQNGILLGSTYNTHISELSGFKHGLELQYFDYGNDFSSIGSWYFEPARENGMVLQLAWQPHDGLDMVVENDYLIQQAKYLESTGCKILLRFANEMNDETCSWYTADYNKYIEKFRLVARVFRQYAPSVALVWAPNFYPYTTVDLYYPGDEYVDYVGLSVYQEYNPANDPLGQGIERGRWSDVLDHVYDTYGDRKPIIVSEGGCSTISVWTGEDITDFAVKQMELFYTYLPIKYPNVKMAVLFNSEDWGGREFRLANKPTLLEAYKKGIASSKRYLSNATDPVPSEYYYELHNNFTLPAETVKLCSYIAAPLLDFDTVTYTINGTIVAAKTMPYSVTLNLAPYAGQTVELQIQALAGTTIRVEETFKIKVG